MEKLRKISIVFEETGGQGGKAFNVYLSGWDRDIAKVPENDRSPAEWLSFNMMSFVVSLLQKAGVVQTVTDNKPGKGGH